MHVSNISKSPGYIISISSPLDFQTEGPGFDVVVFFHTFFFRPIVLEMFMNVVFFVLSKIEISRSNDKMTDNLCDQELDRPASRAEMKCNTIFQMHSLSVTINKFATF